jgi:hypothetical protein
LAGQQRNDGDSKKLARPLARDFTTALFMLRAFQMGLKINDLGQMSFGFVMDMMTELNNDGYDYPRKATQDDIDKTF